MKINTEKIFVIHYTKLKDRKESMDSQLPKLEVEFQYMDKYDKEELNDEVLSKYYNNDQESHNKKVRPLWDVNVHSYRHLNEAELSCTIKHLEAIGEVSKQCTNHGLIFEDDALLSDNFSEVFNDLIEKTPKDWDVILMGEGCGDWFIQHKLQGKTPAYIDNEKGIFKASHPATNCAEAYLIKSKAAKKVYDSSVPFDLVSDWEIAYQFYKFDLNVYWWVPPIVNQGSKNGKYSSTLDEGQRK
jgi:GR25 family glycosyltransferase involved in LPS biosynthesis|tara:strand:- start:14023 stop:14751 length:729 start_codon:yes stop_codon:yes gene_type:complete